MIRIVISCFLLGLCAMVFNGAHASAPPSSVAIPALGAFLDESGALVLPKNYSGRIDPSGYRLTSGQNGSPRFVPAANDADDARWAAGFQLPNGCDGGVQAMTAGPDGALYMGGGFVACGDLVVNGIVRYDRDTDSWSALGSGEGKGVGGTVYAITFIGDDLYVGGRFDEVNVGEPVQANSIARWDGNTWSPVGTGFDGTYGAVYALAAFDSKLIAAGEFEYANVGDPVRVNHIAEWTGSQWQAMGSAGGAGFNDIVRALAVHDGELYAGGFFTHANVGNDIPAGRVARWDGSTWSALPGGINSVQGREVEALASHLGHLYIGGSFYHPMDGGYAKNIVRWDGTDWSFVGSSGWNGTNGRVSVLHSIGGFLYVGGEFDRANSGGTASSGIWVDGLALWHNGWSAIPYLPYGTDGYVYAMQEIAGNLYIGGSIVDWRAGVRIPHLANYRNVLGADLVGRGSGMGVGGVVNAMLVHEGELYVAGALGLMSSPEISHVAKWDGVVWHNLLSVNAMDRFSFSDFQALAVFDGQLYVGGNFRKINGAWVNGLARWDGSGWHAVGGGVMSNSIDSDAVVFSLFGTDDRLYVGGWFQVAGESYADGFALWDGVEWHVPTEELLGWNGSAQVYAIAEFQGRIYVAGILNDFYHLGVHSLAVWDGAEWSSAHDIDGAIYALAVHDGSLYVGGGFTEVNPGAPVAASNIARWDGSQWHPVGKDGEGLDGYVSTLASAGGSLYVGGLFTTANVGSSPVACQGVARWDGHDWSPLGSGVGPRFDLPMWGVVMPNVNAFAADDSGVYVGGSFKLAGNKPASNIAKYLFETDRLFANGFE